MQWYCTFFDKNYLSRGLALHHSLERHCGAFELWILCMDAETEQTLAKAALRNVRLVSSRELEDADQGLVTAKMNRSRIEYYFTSKASLVLHVLNRCPEANRVTYLDADLFFFAAPELLEEELAGCSVAISPHRFSIKNKHLEAHGLYNAGWLMFRRDPDGLACLEWWRERCLEWCRDVVDEGRYADQKYIDRFPSMFRNVRVVQHPGANLAPWNLDNVALDCTENTVRTNGRPLIFFHFHGFKRIVAGIFDAGTSRYGAKLSNVARSHVYGSYLRCVNQCGRKIEMGSDTRLEVGIRTELSGSTGTLPAQILMMVRRIRNLGHVLIDGSYIVSRG